jgi:hypothetical protein
MTGCGSWTAFCAYQYQKIQTEEEPIFISKGMFMTGALQNISHDAKLIFVLTDVRFFKVKEAPPFSLAAQFRSVSGTCMPAVLRGHVDIARVLCLPTGMRTFGSYEKRRYKLDYFDGCLLVLNFPKET